MHCHIDFMSNGEEVATEAAAAGTLLFANTVTAQGWITTCERFARFDNVIVGFGMHPWWVAEEAADENARRQETSQRAEHKRLAEEAADDGNNLEQVEKRARVLRMLDEYDPTFIGEVGLDFGWRHLASRHAQTEMFAAIARWAAARGDKLISLHSIKATRETLDILEEAGAIRSCACVFHWFSGSSDQLKRAIDAGCYFSCGPRMLATGKGREYVKAIPIERLLLETDAPPEQGKPYSYEAIHRDLASAANTIAAIKGEAARETIDQTSRSLLMR